MADNNFMIITGAGGGIMAAGNKGASSDMSFGVNIQLPFEQSPNPYIDNDPKLVSYRYFLFVNYFLSKSLMPPFYVQVDLEL